MVQPELQRPLQETLAEAEARIAEMRRRVAEEEAKLRGLLPSSLPPPPVLSCATILSRRNRTQITLLPVLRAMCIFVMMVIPNRCPRLPGILIVMDCPSCSILLC
jgi:hypothetical protein